MTTLEACKVIGCNKSTIMRMVHANVLTDRGKTPVGGVRHHYILNAGEVKKIAKHYNPQLRMENYLKLMQTNNGHHAPTPHVVVKKVHDVSGPSRFMEKMDKLGSGCKDLALKMEAHDTILSRLEEKVDALIKMWS